jgi:hypothetical protein
MDEKKPRRRWISKLKEGEHVVCRVPIYNFNNEIREWSCNFIANYQERKMIAVCYLDGYRSESAYVPYQDVLAVYDKDGPVMKFDGGCLYGPSALLIRR